MAKEKEKHYIVVLEQCDEQPEIRNMTGKQIREMIEVENKKYPFGNNQYDIAIIEGNLIKNFDNVIDLSKL